MGESNTVVSAYKMYSYLQQYCPHPSICSLSKEQPILSREIFLNAFLSEFQLRLFYHYQALNSRALVVLLFE